MTTTGRTISFRLDGPASDCYAVIRALELLGADILPQRSPNRKRRDRGVFWRGQFAVPADAPPPDAEVTRPDQPSAAKKPRQTATGVAMQCVRDRIRNGELRPGDRLPPSTGDHGAKRAYRILRAEGLIEYVPGHGMCVAGGPPPRPATDLKVDNAANLLRIQITSGKLAGGTRLTWEGQARRLSTTKKVIRRALDVLLAENLVERQSDGSLYVIGGGPPQTQATRAADWIRMRIRSGTFVPGTALPTRPRIASAVRVSTSSMAGAYKLLQEEGEIHFVPAAGWFVSGAVVQTPPTIADQIVTYVRDQIANCLAPGARAPKYGDIRETFSASTMTVNRAYTRLKNDRLLVTRGSQGVFVADTPEVAALRGQRGKPDPSAGLESPDTRGSSEA